MKLLAEISDATIGQGTSGVLGKTYELRKSARAILSKPDGTIAIQYLATHFFHKLPGGGIENGESIHEALQREIREEVGCACVVGNPVGMTIEYRDQHSLIHISYCYTAGVIGDISHTALEQGEIDEGMQTVWMEPELAILKMESDIPITYQGPFILKRELAFLKEYIATQK